jgi:hypothetical protein
MQVAGQRQAGRGTRASFFTLSKKEGTQAQDRAIDDFTLKGICAGII